MKVTNWFFNYLFSKNSSVFIYIHLVFMSSSSFEFVVWTLTKVPGVNPWEKKNQKPIGRISVVWLSSFQFFFVPLYPPPLCYHGLYIYNLVAGSPCLFIYIYIYTVYILHYDC